MADIPLPAAHDLQIKLHFLCFVRVISPIFLHIYTAQLVPAHFVCRISRHHTHMQKFCAKYMTCASICKTTLIYCPDSIPLINPLLTVIFPVHLIRLNNLYFQLTYPPMIPSSGNPSVGCASPWMWKNPRRHSL